MERGLIPQTAKLQLEPSPIATVPIKPLNNLKNTTANHKAISTSLGILRLDS